MNADTKATIAGAILAAATAAQPMVAAIEGQFTAKDAAMILLAVVIAAFGYLVKVK